MATQSRITELVAQIASNSLKVEQSLLSSSSPLPSFLPDGPRDLVMASEDAETARLAAIDASIELQDLLQGPMACLRPAINATSLEAIYRWNVPNHVPLEGDISFSNLAERVRMSEPIVRRIVRYAIVWHRVFREPRSGYVAHSAASRLLVEDSASFDTLGMMFDESWQAFAHTCDAMQTFGDDELNHTGYALAHHTDKPVWEYYKEHPTRGKRFANSMQAMTSTPGYSLSHLVSGYDWSSIPEGSTVIDVGGSEGHASIAIAKRHPHLRFVVQDLPEVITNAKQASNTGDDVEKRIEYMAHDFLTAQPREGDVYLFRWIFHDWPDTHVIRILQNLIPVMKSGTKIVVSDTLMPTPGQIPLVVERYMRFMDMCMMSFFNSREREASDWDALFKEADARFQHVKSWTPPGSTLSIIEATWVA